MGVTLGIVSSTIKSDASSTGCSHFPTATHVEIKETEAGNDDKTEANKRVRSPHKSPNQIRRKAHKSFLQMMEYELMEEEMAELCTFDFIEPSEGEAVLTLNTSPSIHQGNTLLHVPVRNVDLAEMKKPGGW